MMTKKVYESIQTMRAHFGWDKTDTKEFLVDALLAEVHELKESLTLDEEAFQSELADVLMYALTLCMDGSYDVEAIVERKAKEVMTREY